MPIDSHVDLIELSKEQIDAGKAIVSIANQEKKISNTRDKLASEYDGLIRAKSEAARKFEEVAKKIEDLTRTKSDSAVDKSKVKKNDADNFRVEANKLKSDIEYLTGVSDSLKDLSYQVQNFVDKLSEIGIGYKNIGSALKDFIKADQTLFEKKDKLMKPEKIGKMEDNKAEADREYEQARKDMNRRMEEYNKESEKFEELLSKVADALKR